MQHPQSGHDVTNHYDADDTRRSERPASTLVDRIVAQRPAFHLLAGDICYADPQGLGAPETFSTQLPETNDYDAFAWSVYFAMIERSAASTPWMLTTGNHDLEALYGTPQNVPPFADASHGYGGHLLRLDLPGNGPSGCPSVYTFVHANVAVLSLDANDLTAEIPAATGYSGGAQVTWLDSTVRPAEDGTTYVLPGYDEGARNPATQVPESVDWSQARYDNYAVLAVDVVPAPPGQRTTMTLRAVTDLGVEIDRVVLERVARGPAPATPAVPPPAPAGERLPATATRG